MRQCRLLLATDESRPARREIAGTYRRSLRSLSTWSVSLLDLLYIDTYWVGLGGEEKNRCLRRGDVNVTVCTRMEHVRETLTTYLST